MAVLVRSAAHRFPDTIPFADKIETYLNGLHLKDLALACACAEGREPAWEHFFTRFRDYLYTAASAVIRLSPVDLRARQLADNLYAELYGVRSGTARRPLFSYFHGRSKLETWLRTLLAQRYVDEIRSAKRLEPLEDNPGDSPPIPQTRGWIHSNSGGRYATD